MRPKLSKIPFKKILPWLLVILTSLAWFADRYNLPSRYGLDFWRARPQECPARYLYDQQRVSWEDHVEEVLLRNLIFTEFPQLANETMADYERVVLLRQWAARHTDTSNREGLLDDSSSAFNPNAWQFDYYSRDAPEIYAAFMEDKGGVWCGGNAFALMKLYEMFGYRAFTINIGSKESPPLDPCFYPSENRLRK